MPMTFVVYFHTVLQGSINFHSRVNRRQRKYVSVFCCLMYLASSVYIEVGHTDIIDLSLRTVHRLLSHDCSGREMHKPLGNGDECPICIRSSQTTAFVVPAFFLLGERSEIVSPIIVTNFHPRSKRIPSLFRGPPIS